MSRTIQPLIHALPLHYVPHLLHTGVLCSQAELRRRNWPVRPRPTAARRDRKLHLDGYVHLSPVPVTPLLRDKCERGYGHALLAFAPNLLARESTALCRFNAKSWRHRDDFAPVTIADEKEAVWNEWHAGRYPSLEILVPDQLPLVPHLQTLHLPDVWARDWLGGFADLLTVTPPCQVTPAYFPGLEDYDRNGLADYAEQCRMAKALLPPPDLPFD